MNENKTDPDLAARWRLILGRYSDRALNQVQLDAEQLRLERTLDYLYNREYEQRGHVAGESRHGSLDDSQLTAINWLNQARKLFPQSTFERVQTQAVERYQLDALLKDPQSLKSLEPTPQLAKALLTMRGRMNAQTREAVREIIKTVVEQIVARLKPNFINAIHGRRNRFRRSLIANSQNFDWRRTIRENLKHYNHDLNKLIIQQPFFNARVQRHLPWTVVLCVDQSGSMMNSVRYSAICASSLASLPAVKVHLQVKLLGLAALDEQANPVYDIQMAQKLNERGMSVAALTPEHFAEWMAEVMQ